MITIKSRQEGFRRCGVAHSVAATSYPDDRFSEKELVVLQNEPMLHVVVESNDPSKSTGLKANDAIAAIKEAPDRASLDEFTQGEKRKSVVEAIEARRKELEA